MESILFNVSLVIELCLLLLAGRHLNLPNGWRFNDLEQRLSLRLLQAKSPVSLLVSSVAVQDLLVICQFWLVLAQLKRWQVF
jgi:hypothetical protein